MNLPNWIKKHNSIDIYVEGVRKKAEEEVMVARVALGVLLLALAIGWLGLMAIPEPLLGIGALVAGIGVLVGR